MLLFRSEEHVDRWVRQRGGERGEMFPVEVLWRLARTWYRHRPAPDWRRFTADEAQDVFESLGLTGPFWRLAGPTG